MTHGNHRDPQAGGTPLFPDIGVIGLVPDQWGGIIMPRHRILAGLARYFNVVWMDPAREWRQWWIGREADPPPLNTWRPAWSGFRVYRPGRWLPRLHRPAALARLSSRLRLQHARRLLEGAGARRIVLYVWRPEFGDALDLMPGTPSCYHIDDEYSFSEFDLPIPPEEERLLRRASRVIIHSPALFEKKGHFNPQTILVPNGVDYHAYATPVDEPADLQAIPHPRAVYTGVVKGQLDFALILSLAERHTEWSFVLVGPRLSIGAKAELVARLERLPNVHFLGGKPIEALPGYVQHADVTMMCYELTAYTHFIYPMKLHEYLASGRPVIGTPIRTLLDFSHVVSLARTTDDWSAALSASLAPAANAPEAVAARRAVAAQYDWDALAARVARAFCEMLGPNDVARFDRETTGPG